MMIEINKKEDCCGCNACMNICPKQCIEMISDKEGFLYPVIDKDKCMDCGLCEKACPIQYMKNAIAKKTCLVQHTDNDITGTALHGTSMASDREGLINLVVQSTTHISTKSAEVDLNLEKDCDVCQHRLDNPITCKSGSLSLRDEISISKPATYAMINKDETIREKSSSGGIFTLIAEEILSQNGVVFGAAMTKDCRAVEHICVEHIPSDSVNLNESCVEFARQKPSVNGSTASHKNGLEKLRGSKYLQSNIGICYQQAKEYLEAGRKVLFTGTPCQIEGLRTYLGKEYENLFCMDFICHGVPSSKVWKKYVDFREACAGKPAQQTFFRHKKYGWKKFAVFFEYSKNTAYWGKLGEDLYLKAFLSDICLRPSCYACRFKKVNRVSDITVADFWGIEKILPEMDDDKGTSLVMIHSDKGQQMLDKIAEKVIYQEVDFNVVPKTNPAMVKSAKIHFNREKFFAELEEKSFDTLVEKYVRQKITWKSVVGKALRKMGLFEIVKGVYTKVKK